MPDPSPFILIQLQRPASSNNRNRKYQEGLRNAAAAKFGGRGELSGDLYARIVWFCRIPHTQDIDNVPKQLLDSLKNVVYADDRAIKQCLSVAIDLRRDYEISAAGIPEKEYQQLMEHLGDESQDHILYVEIGPISNQTVVFGPIDGDSL